MPQLTPEEKDAAKKKAAAEAARKKAKSQEDDADEDEEEDEESDDEGDESDKDEDQEPDPDEKELGFSDKQKAYIKKLRSENAKTRTQAKTLADRFSKLETGLKGIFGEDDDKLSPEEKLEKVKAEKIKLAQEKQESEFNQSLAEAAVEYGVSKANLKYFKYLVAEAASELEEGEELTDDDIKKLAKEAGRSASPKNSSVGNEGGKGNPDPDEEDGDVTLEEFQAMGIGARSALYQKDKALYEKLVLKERGAKKKK